MRIASAVMGCWKSKLAVLKFMAENGDPEAQKVLGDKYHYAFGNEVAQDDLEAIEWYRRAAGQGHAGAQFQLGWAYSKGRGVAKDNNEAAKWYQKAADQDYKHAPLNLGLLYFGVLDNPSLGIQWLQKAATEFNNYDGSAEYMLGIAYESGRGTLVQFGEALKWYRQAADLNEVDAQYRLGLMYANGRGVPADSTEAARWFRTAAENGDHRQAQHELGLAYQYARGCSQDFAEAMKWYRKAAIQNEGESKIQIGLMYINGEGVPRSFVDAHAWWTLAKADGKDMQKALAKVELDLTSEEITKAAKLAIKLSDDLRRDGEKRKNTLIIAGVEFPLTPDERSEYRRLTGS